MYSIVWKYKIKPEFRDEFELEYGQEGRWAKLFDRSSSYHGSILHSSVDDRNMYLLIDQWSSQGDYEHFLKQHERSYQSISTGIEHLYSLEERIGGFNTKQNPNA